MAMCVSFDDDNTKQNIKRMKLCGLFFREKDEEETKVLDDYYVAIPHLQERDYGCKKW